MNGHPRFYEILKEMAELHSRKNHDYSDSKDPLSNLKMCESMGICDSMVGLLVRLSDKYSRLVQLIAKKKENLVKDESVKDTLMDMAVYSILGIILLEEKDGHKKGKR